MDIEYECLVDKNFISRLNKFKDIYSKNDNKNILRDINHNYSNLSENYISEYKNSNYVQYSNLYFIRLNEIRKELDMIASNKWSGIKICKNILDVKGKEVQIIIGIMYKEMPLKPSILKGLDSILGYKKIESYVNETEDFIIIEDNSGRIRISNKSIMNNFSPSHYVSGIPAAIKGILDEKGVFIVQDICFYYTNYCFNLKSISRNPGYIAFVSGLRFGIEGVNDDFNQILLARNLLLDFFQNEEGNEIANNIQRLVIAGNIIHSPEETDLVEKGSFLKQELNNRIYRIILQNYDNADNYLNILCNCIKIDLMPGTEDNSSSFFPQSPINNIMLPNSSCYDSLNLVSNPYKFKYEDIEYCGTSGQNIDNIRKYSTIGQSAIDLMSKTLEWGHIAPTAPDGLRTYPFNDKDPLILRNIPNVYFTGNQMEFSTEVYLYNNCPVRLISIPDFYLSSSIVLLDTQTLEAIEYRFELF